MPNHRSNSFRHTDYPWLTLGIFVVLVATFIAYVHTEKQIDRANELRQQSILLADELRHSSDDLTRMVRTYVVTDDPAYKRHYQEILDIRDGRKPRPLDYQGIYWDLVMPDDARPRPAREATPLLALMRQAGFTDAELAQLSEAKANSDALTRTEFAAMALIESASPPSAANRSKAIHMLHDAAYHQAKAAIMAPIGQFYKMADQRTLESVRAAETRAIQVRLAFVLLGVLLVLLILSIRRRQQEILGGALDNVYSGIAKLGRGDFSVAIPVAEGMEDSVLGWLSEMQAKLARLDAERRQTEELLRESEERLRLAMGAANQGWFDADLDTGKVNVSPEYPRILGYAPDEFASDVSNWLTHIHPEDRAAVGKAFQACIADGGPYTMAYRRQTKSGDWKWIESVGKIVAWNDDKRAARMIGIHTDITARKAAEDELKKYQNHLETLVEARTVSLSIAKEAAEAANRAKSTFLANMSHELRTPMNAIIGMASLALRRATDPKLQEQLGRINQASQHLLAVINDILDISKIEAERLTLERVGFRLGEVLENLISLLGHKAADKELKLYSDLPPEVARLALLGDPLRLGQILLNLTGNAIKFTEQGSISVQVRISRETADDVLLRFEVEDSGIGIAPDDQKRLFTAFEQADGSMTRKYGGTGLGLAISKRLVHLMDGDIGVVSTPDRGSTFWFTVRLDKAPRDSDDGAVPPAPTFAHASAEAQLKNRFAGARILLAEDEPINQEVSRGLLAEADLAVDLARDGAEAVALARHTRYDLILMDMQMPNLNGIDATRAIRALPGYADIPILAMTANAFNEDRQTCLAAGMNDHIGKPVSPGRLFETLLKWLAHP